MPSRRNVIRIALTASLAAALAAGSPALWRAFQQEALSSVYRERAELALQTSVKNLQIARVDMQDIFNAIATDCNVPISYIEDDLPARASVNTQARTVEDALNQIVLAAPNYQWRAIRGRLVVLPRGAKYDRRVSNVHIADVPRAEAIDRYMDCLSSQYADFQDFCGGALEGDMQRAMYTEPVTLTPDATVAEHLVQLLGRNCALCFALSRGLDNLHFYTLGNVAPVALPAAPLEKLYRHFFS